MWLVKSCVSTMEFENPATNARSSLPVRTSFRKLDAAACSKAKRSVIDALVSIINPRRRGNSDSVRNPRIVWNFLVVEDPHLFLLKICNGSPVIGDRKEHGNFVYSASQSPCPVLRIMHCAACSGR